MRKPKTLVLDSWAIMAFIEDAPSAERIANLLPDAHDDGVPMLKSVVNAGEIWYFIARRTNGSEADRALRIINDIGITLIDADWALTKVVAGFKVKGSISYADCFAAALTTHEKAALLTGDHEFEQL